MEFTKNNIWKKALKRGMVFCMAGALAASMAACGGNMKKPSKADTKTESTQQQEKSDNGKSTSGENNKSDAKEKTQTGNKKSSSKSTGGSVNKNNSKVKSSTKK